MLYNLIYTVCTYAVQIYLFRPHIGHHGRVEIKIKNSAIKLTVMVTKSADGHPIMKATNCEVDLHLSIHVHGSGRCFYNVFVLCT